MNCEVCKGQNTIRIIVGLTSDYQYYHCLDCGGDFYVSLWKGSAS